MNITATRFATKIRTWLMLAALTGLLIAIGGALGGAALYVFVALAVLMNVVGYWYKILEAIKPRPVIPAAADPNLRDYRTGDATIAGERDRGNKPLASAP